VNDVMNATVQARSSHVIDKLALTVSRVAAARNSTRRCLSTSNNCNDALSILLAVNLCVRNGFLNIDFRLGWFVN
jgi:hypothetical protein